AFEQRADAATDEEPLKRADEIGEADDPDEKCRRIDAGAVQYGRHRENRQHRDRVKYGDQPPEIRSLQQIWTEARSSGLQTQMRSKIDIRKSEEARCKQDMTDRRCNRDALPERPLVDGQDIAPGQKVVNAEYEQRRQ